ncbi:serine/arginine repetitive matrix protein 2-like isoform X2 [Armigeres subalbatus]|uniref:serine/arginine repetitive matrix protein 2-like isoform X2 n=1 Tax=Armigeres subalbatus TaxID=124917 RepID=UPI002ED0D2B0
MPITTKRRRQTIFPPDSHVSGNSFISNDRHRNRHRMQPLLEPPGSSSIIEISSAENTPIPTLGLQDPRSSVRISSVQQGRATRLTDVDMVLEDTELPSQRIRTQLFHLDETNTSLVNLDETDMIIRDRPKSSVAQRWTRSGSIIPPEAADTRRSSVYSMVTKRNRQRARSVAQNSSIAVADVVRSKSSARRDTNPEPVKNLSQISEEQSNSMNSSGSQSTPKPFVRELVIQTRTMRKKGKKWSIGQDNTEHASQTSSTPNAIAAESTVVQSTKPQSSSKEPDSGSVQMRRQGRKRSRNKASESATSELSSEPANRPRTRSVSRTRHPEILTRRRRRSRNASDAKHTKCSSSSEETDQRSKPKRLRIQSASRGRSRTKGVAESLIGEPVKQTRPRTRSVSPDRPPEILTTGRKRSHNAADDKHAKRSSNSGEVSRKSESIHSRIQSGSGSRDKTVAESVISKPAEGSANRSRTRSISRTHQPQASTNRRNASNAKHTNQSSSSEEAVPESVTSESAGGSTNRPRTRSVSRTRQPEMLTNRPRTRSVSRTRQPDSLTNSRRRLRNAKDTKGARSRNKDVINKPAEESEIISNPRRRSRNASDAKHTKQSSGSEEAIAESVASESAGRSTNRHRTRSVSRTRQPDILTNRDGRSTHKDQPPSSEEDNKKSKSLRRRNQSKSLNRSHDKADVESVASELRDQTENVNRRRHRNLIAAESNRIEHTKRKSSYDSGLTMVRSRIRSISQSCDATESSNNSIKAAGNSKKRTKTKSSLTATPNTTSRAKSVPREVMLSPPSSSIGNKSSNEHNIPVYRKYAENVLKLAVSPAVKSTKHKSTSRPADGAGSDVYMFDSPSQSSSGSDHGGGGSKVSSKATKGSSAKRRPKPANVSSRSNRITPLKKSVFGTNMHTISSVVKKIGGGPVRRKSDKESTATSSSEIAKPKDVVHTSTLAAMVQAVQPSTQHIAARTPSPAIVDDDDLHQDDFEDRGFEMENIPDVEIPTPLSPPRINPQIQRVLQREAPHQVHTPDKTQPNNTLNFSPLGASSPWRIQNENVLPKTFYFARSKDLLPSYESDLVVQDENHAPKPVSHIDVLPPPAPVPAATASPMRPVTFARPTTNKTSKPSAVMFTEIQKSYDQLKATSDMSEKLITAMRKYKSNVHQTTSLGDESTPEELFTKFRQYEENMKKTYQKLKQWYDRSKHTYTNSMKAIEQAVPTTQAQKQLVENFRRNSERFLTMMDDLESAINDSNIENLSPSKSVEKSQRPAFKDIILTDRNMNDRNRSPLKTLDIVNVPPRFSPIKSPLVKASFPNRLIAVHSKSRDRFSRLSLTKPTKPPEVSAIVPAESVIEVADTLAEEHIQPSNNLPEQPQKDLFGFESDIAEEPEEDNTLLSVDPTPMKITRETLKERLQSMRKLLPPPSRTTVESSVKNHQNLPRIFNSPRRKRHIASIQNAFSSSTPLAQKRNRLPKRVMEQPEPDASNISAIGSSEVATSTENENTRPPPQESPPAAVFDEPDQELASTSLSSVNRTYSRVPRRKVKRKVNIYLANLGLSDTEEEVSEDESWHPTDSEIRNEKRRKKDQQSKPEKQPGKKRNKKAIEQTAEFQNFVSEFNSMCDQVNQYQLVIEKPTSDRLTKNRP